MLPVKVQSTIEKYRMFRPEDRVLVGVSGGADSVCLLLALKDLGYVVAAAHLNHGLRGRESDGDEHFVQNLCERLDVPFFCARRDLLAEGGNLEAAGRSARKEFFSEVAAQYGFSRIALAHTRDDRIETFLLNLFRGSGTDGLSSMEPVTEDVVRPLIELSRTEIELELQSRNQAWRIDSTNVDQRFLRNRVRHDVIPRLESGFNINIRETLGRTIEILDAENDWLRQVTANWLERYGTKEANRFVLNAESMALEPAALQRRILRSALRSVGPGLENVSFDHVESARSLLREGRSGKLVQMPGGLTVTRNFEQLIVEKEKAPGPEYEFELQIPGEIHIPDLSRVFRARIVAESGCKSSRNEVFVDGGGLGPCVRIRNWKPGDYYRPVGLPAGKLKRLFQRARIPRSQRDRWPVFVADSTIVWVASFPVSREFAPRGSSQRIVAFEAAPI